MADKAFFRNYDPFVLETFYKIIRSSLMDKEDDSSLISNLNSLTDNQIDILSYLIKNEKLSLLIFQKLRKIEFFNKKLFYELF